MHPRSAKQKINPKLKHDFSSLDKKYLSNINQKEEKRIDTRTSLLKQEEEAAQLVNFYFEDAS